MEAKSGYCPAENVKRIRKNALTSYPELFKISEAFFRLRNAPSIYHRAIEVIFMTGELQSACVNLIGTVMFSKIWRNTWHTCDNYSHFSLARALLFCLKEFFRRYCTLPQAKHHTEEADAFSGYKCHRFPAQPPFIGDRAEYYVRFLQYFLLLVLYASNVATRLSKKFCKN